MTRQTSFGKKAGIIIVILLIAGVVVAGIAVQRSTNYQQHASNYNDLNTAQDIISTNNPDGTMGPIDYTTNFSNTFPQVYLGTLDVHLTDPSQEHKPTDIPVTTGADPSHTLPTQVRGNGQGNAKQENQNDNITPGTASENKSNVNAGGPQTVTSLILTVTKVEVHLAYVALPGEKVTPQDQTQGKPTVSPSPKTNQHVDNWETLNIGGIQIVDLVQLANTKNFTSLGLTQLTGGLYTEVRLYVSKATATLADGTHVTLVIPGKANIVRIVEPFYIVSGKTTTLSLDFDAQNSVIKAGDVYLLKPVVAHFSQQNQE
ncbi:MAG TPA: DUF4382 domain-containing protein [Patescibacteria group bacterium]|nr:DUF4382 domain-containing protein [Patescibacteria group bacterium]